MDKSSHSDSLTPTRSVSTTLIAFFLLVLFSIALRSISIQFRGFWVDEFITWRCTQLAPIDLIRNRLAAGHLPLYFFLVKGWAKIFGSTEVGLRSLSVFFSSLSIVAYFFMVRTYESERFSLWTTLLFSIHSINLWAAHEARVYSMIIFVSILSSTLFLKDLAGPSSKRLFLFTCSSLLGLLLHASYAIIYLVQLIFCVSWQRHYRTWKWYRPTRYAIILLPMFPLWILVSYIHGKFTPPSPGGLPPLDTFLKKVAQLAIGDYYKLVWRSWFMWIVVLILLWALPRFFSWIREQKRRDETAPALTLRWFALYWFGGSILLIYVSALVLGRGTASSLRYYSVILGGAVLVMSYTFFLIRTRELRLVCQGTFAALLALNTGAFINSKGDMVREAVAFVEENWQEGDALVVCDDYLGTAAFAFYGTGSKEVLGIPDELTDEDVILTTVSRGVLGKNRLWLLLYYERPSPIKKVLLNHPEQFSLLVHTQLSRRVTIYCFTLLPEADLHNTQHKGGTDP